MYVSCSAGGNAAWLVGTGRKKEVSRGYDEGKFLGYVKWREVGEGRAVLDKGGWGLWVTTARRVAWLRIMTPHLVYQSSLVLSVSISSFSPRFRAALEARTSIGAVFVHVDRT